MSKRIGSRKCIILIVVITLILFSLLIPKWSKLVCSNSKGSVCYGSSQETKYKTFWECKNTKPTNNSSDGIIEWMMAYSRCGLGCRTEGNSEEIKCLIIFDAD